MAAAISARTDSTRTSASACRVPVRAFRLRSSDDAASLNFASNCKISKPAAAREGCEMDMPRDGELVGEWYDRIRREAVEAEVAAAKREGVIEGLGMALDMNQSWDAVTWAAAIKREIERLRAEQKEQP